MVSWELYFSCFQRKIKVCTCFTVLADAAFYAAYGHFSLDLLFSPISTGPCPGSEKCCKIQLIAMELHSSDGYDSEIFNIENLPNARIVIPALLVMLIPLFKTKRYADLKF